MPLPLESPDPTGLNSMQCSKCLTVYTPKLFRAAGDEKTHVDITCPTCGKGSAEAATGNTKKRLAD